MIQVSHLIKKYSVVTALDDVSFTIEKGEIVGLLGPNGAGKSTIMNIMTGFTAASSGTVKLDGCEIYSQPKSVKQKIGYLPEIPPLYPDMTVRAYLKFVCGLKKFKGDKKSELERIMQAVGITDVSDRIIKNLSKGYRQRVGIAQALIGNPELLIFDEPTVGLDPAQIIELRELIKKLADGRTVIISSHILSELANVCDRYLIINNGKLAADLRADELDATVSDRPKLQLEVEGDSRKVIAAIKRASGVSSVKLAQNISADINSYTVEYRKGRDIKRAIFRELAAADCPILKMEGVEKSLEQLFLQLTSDKASQRGEK